MTNSPPTPTLTLQRTFTATPQRVFDAWANPEQIKHWFAPGDGYTHPFVDVDFKVGGQYRIAFKGPDGETHVVAGQYIDIQPPHKIVMTWAWEKPNDYADVDTLVTVEINDNNGSTQLTLTHVQLADQKMCDEHAGGWNGALDRLVTYMPS